MAGTAKRMNGIGVGGLVELAMVLASGFILCAWEPWRGYLRRQPPPIPYFTFLAVGVIWWMVVTAVISVLRQVCGWWSFCLPTFGEMMGFAGNQQHGVNAIFWAIIFGIILLLIAEKAWLHILKWRVWGETIDQRIYNRAVRHLRHLKGWEFEKMMSKAANDDILIMLTLSNHKIYIGRPNQISRDESGRERWVSIVPWKSGHRCQKTGKVDLTTDYEWMLSGEASHGSSNFFDMCIPIREVVSFQFFDPKVYERFQLGAGQVAADNAAGDNEEGQAEVSGQSAEKRRSVDPVNIDGNHERERSRR